MAWFIERSPITNGKFAAIYISGTPGMDGEDVDRELREIARLQAIEAAARGMLERLESNWDISELDADSYYETDLTGRVMQQLAAALTQPGGDAGNL